MTEEMKKMDYEELKGYLEKKYDKLNEVQANKENENKQRDKCFKLINQGIEIIKRIKDMTDNIDDIKECDSMNMNNVNIIINKVVDMMMDNENRQHNIKVEEINRLKKRITTNKIINVKREICRKRILSRVNNEYITSNLDTLEEWSGHQVSQVLYDSDIDGNDKEIFRNKILNHEHLYFIVIDSSYNVFGHYNEANIDKVGSFVRDKDSFVFTLNNNNRCGIKKFNFKSNYSDHSCFLDIDRYWQCGPGSKGYYCIYTIGNNDCQISDMTKSFEEMKKTDLIGTDFKETNMKFTTKRLIVIEMC